MTDAAELRSGKGHKDENFPVASALIRPEHRAPIMAFYDFVRIADDIADHTTLSPAEKLAHLDRLEATLLGSDEAERAGVVLREALAARKLSPRHAQDLLAAFRMDVTKLRYADWDELIHYCRYSAMPVGRFVLDVHGESRDTWPASDAVCAALQINNHLQDCAKDFRELGRVYLPQDVLADAGVTVEALRAPQASPALLGVLHALAGRTNGLIREGSPLVGRIRDRRLALEIAVIVQLAERINAALRFRDPLKDRVHLHKGEMLGVAVTGIMRGLFGRLFRRAPAPAPSAAP